MTENVKGIQQYYWRSDEVPYLELRSTYHSSQEYKPHSHLEFSVGAIEAGTVQFKNKEGTQIAQAGDLVIFAPNQVHSCNPTENGYRSYHMLYIDEGWCLRKLSGLYGRKVNELACVKTLVKSPQLFNDYLRLIELTREEHSLEIEASFEQLLAVILGQFCVPSGNSKGENPLTQSVRELLFNDLIHPPTLEEMAQGLGYRKETLVRAFKKDTGLPPMSFLNNARIEKAKSLLKAGMDISDVAMATGFVDQSHFHKVFVSHTAATPGQYQLKGQ